jgi:hypothetical protein
LKVRPSLIFAGLAFLPVFLAATASADQIVIEKGEWTMTSDFYLTTEQGGQLFGEEGGSETVTECWKLDEEVVIDESFIVPAGCQVLDWGARRTDYLIDLQLACVVEGAELDGSVLIAANKDRSMLSARYWPGNVGSDPRIRVEGILMGRRNRAC